MSLTYDELNTLTTELLGGQNLGETLFSQLLNMAKNRRESSRDWVILRSFDSSISFSSSDEYDDTQTLPARFLRVYSADPSESGVFLVNGSERTPLSPIPFVQRYNYKDTDGYYYIDHKNNKIGRTGTKSGTLHLYFLQGSEDIADGTSWTFPDFAHPLLAFDVAVIHKGGIDWDTVNANQVPYNRLTIRELESQLAMWDARLQQQELGV